MLGDWGCCHTAALPASPARCWPDGCLMGTFQGFRAPAGEQQAQGWGRKQAANQVAQSQHNPHLLRPPFLPSSQQNGQPCANHRGHRVPGECGGRVRGLPAGPPGAASGPGRQSVPGPPLTHMASSPSLPPCLFFLLAQGSGKTTLINYILQGNHGKRIAIIEASARMHGGRAALGAAPACSDLPRAAPSHPLPKTQNEFGEVGVDDALVFETQEEIFEMNNGKGKVFRV